MRKARLFEAHRPARAAVSGPSPRCVVAARARSVWLPLVALLGACSDPGSMSKKDLSDPDRIVVEPPLVPGCNPLGGGIGEDCLLPFPSDVFTRPDPMSPTGLCIELPAGALPTSRKGPRLDPAQFRGRDGFSPASPILVYFPRPAAATGAVRAIDPMLLPGPNRVEETLSAKSTVQLFRYDTGERVPVFAELDQNAGERERQVIVIYPQLRLRDKSRYVVAVRGLRTGGADGPLLPPLTGFQVLRDAKVAPGSARSKVAARYQQIFGFLEQQGVPRGELQAAWDFTTASDEAVTGRLVRMRDQALSYKPTSEPLPPAITVLRVLERPRETLLRQIIATFSVPSFLRSDADGRLLLGTDGEPLPRGIGQFALIIHIPTCVERTMLPLPVMIFGHGLFGDPLSEMDSSYQREIINRLCMVQIGTTWLGLSEMERTYAATEVMADFNNLVQLTDRLQQAHINFLVLARLVRSGFLERMPELQSGGRILVDSKRVGYYGISNGAIQGPTLLALSPDLERGAFNVGGGFWSHMIWRSANFRDLATLLTTSYPDPLERQVLVALSQWHWDYTDPATYAPHLLRDPLPGGGGTKRVLYQEGLGDAQVPNLSTRALVRTMALPLLHPPAEAVFGIGQVNAPAPAAYVQYDVGQIPRPGGDNVPPKDNKVHESIRRLEAAKGQLQIFLRDQGEVFDTCGGKPCVSP